MSELRSDRVRILLAHHHSEELSTVLRALEKQGYDVGVTESGESIPMKAGLYLPDLVVLGIPLPDVETSWLYERLKGDEKTRDIPVLTIIPRDEPQSMAQALGAGADIVTSPLQSEELLARVRVRLALKALRKELVERGVQLEHAKATSRADGLLQSLGNVIYEADGAGIVTYISPAVESLIGYTASEVVGRYMGDFIHSEDLLRMRETFHSVLAGQTVGNEYRAATRSGEVRWIRTSSHPTYDGDRVNGVQGVLADITERKQAEEEIQRLARFPSENPNPVLRIAEDGIILYANGASSPLLDVWGCQEGDRVSGQWRDLTQEVLESRRSRDAETQVGDRVLSLTFAPVTDAGYVNVYGLDITERKLAEEALKRSEERFELAERASNIGSWDWDVRTDALHWTSRIEPMFGLAPGAFEGTYDAFLRLVHQEDRQYLMESVDACVESGVDYAIEHRIVWPDGTVRWVSESGDVIRDESGRALRMLGVVQDITERKRAEEQVRQQNAFLTSVVESLAHPFYVVDVDDYTVQMANTAAYPGALPEGATCYSLFHGRSTPCVGGGTPCPVEEIRRTGEYATVEHVHRDAEGNKRAMEVRGYPVFDDEGNLARVIHYSLDVTERRKAEEALRAAKEAAEKARGEEQKRRREAEKRRQVAEGLADVVAALNSNRPLDEVLGQIAKRAGELLEADGVAICPPDFEGGPTCSNLAECVFAGSVARMDSPASRRALERALVRREPVAVPDAAAGPSIPVPDGSYSPVDVAGTEPFRALLAVPIMVQDEPCGGLLLSYAHPRSLSDDEVELARVFGSKIALTLENTRLREEVRQAAARAERDRLARDLHDSVTQALFSASLVAEVLPRMWERDPEEARTGLEELRQLTGGALAEMRTMLLELRPEALIETSLHDLLLQLIKAATSRTQISKTLDIGSSPVVPPDVHIAFYRVAQEALHNVVRHAGATELNLSLEAVPPVSRRDTDDWRGRLVLRVGDNGRGFDMRQIRGDHLGLDIMRERSETIGAELTVDSQPDQGTQVILIWDSNGAGDNT